MTNEERGVRAFIRDHISDLNSCMENSYRDFYDLESDSANMRSRIQKIEHYLYELQNTVLELEAIEDSQAN